MQRAVFFDFDGTLVPQKNSLTWRFVRALPDERLRADKTLAFVSVMSALIPRAAAGLIEHDAMYVCLVEAVFRGLPRWAAQSAGERVAEQIHGSVYPAMRDVLAQHRYDCGHLVSANLEPLLAPFCRALGLACVATELEHERGAFTGRLASPLCKREEKVRRIRERVGEGVRTVAYGNSLEDLAMLRFVDEPVLVNPEHTLSRAAELRFARRIFTSPVRRGFVA